MEIKYSKYIGFCNGVTRSIDEANKILDNEQKVYALGNLVHNDKVIENLKAKGLIVIDKLPKEKEKVIIRAHGVPKDVYVEAKERGINLIDLTCPRVLAIHNLAKKHINENNFIILIGNKKHPEVIGTISYCGEKAKVIEEENDIKALTINEKNIVIIVQTTFSLEKFNDLCESIKRKFSNKNIKIYNTICNATKERQEEVKELAKKVSCMLIIGDKKSSNTNKLYELAKQMNDNTFFIEDASDIPNLEEFDTIGVGAGASTPKEYVKKLISGIK